MRYNLIQIKCIYNTEDIYFIHISVVCFIVFDIWSRLKRYRLVRPFYFLQDLKIYTVIFTCARRLIIN